MGKKLGRGGRGEEEVDDELFRGTRTRRGRREERETRRLIGEQVDAKRDKVIHRRASGRKGGMGCSLTGE